MRYRWELQVGHSGLPSDERKLVMMRAKIWAEYQEMGKDTDGIYVFEHHSLSHHIDRQST